MWYVQSTCAGPLRTPSRRQSDNRKALVDRRNQIYQELESTFSGRRKLKALRIITRSQKRQTLSNTLACMDSSAGAPHASSSICIKSPRMHWWQLPKRPSAAHIVARQNKGAHAHERSLSLYLRVISDNDPRAITTAVCSSSSRRLPFHLLAFKVTDRRPYLPSAGKPQRL